MNTSQPVIDTKVEQAARRAAEAWLARIDSGKYAEAWDAAAELMRRSIKREDFARALDASRGANHRARRRFLRVRHKPVHSPGLF